MCIRDSIRFLHGTVSCTSSSLVGRCTVGNMSSRRSPGQRAGLTRPLVLATARELLAKDGLPALTMRSLAQRLEVSPNALYSHIESKTTLIDDVLDDVLAEVDVPDVAVTPPAVGLQALMASTYGVLLAHPDLVPLYLARQGA